jgi:hypothetical protein
MQSSYAGLRYLGAGLLLALATSFSTVAHAGQGVWTGGGPYDGNITALAINPVNPATLYAATINAVFKSTDSGGTWAITAPRGGFYYYYSALAINPSTPATLYAGLDGVGVVKSTDSGGIWTNASTGLTSTGVIALAINPSAPSTLYAGTYNGGVFKSTNSGGTWAAANTGLTSSDVRALAINPVDPTTLYAGTYNGGVFKSTNSGGTWTAANTGLTNLQVLALAINPADTATLYAGTGGAGVFKSTNSGGTWAATNTGLPNQSGVVAVVINPFTPATLYAGTGLGVFRSTDSGGTWAAFNAGLPNLNVSALALDPTGATTLYAGVGGWGVWQLSAPPGSTTTTFLLPASAHSPGAGGAFYTTNLAVTNVGAAPASFTMKFLGHGQDGSAGPEQTFNLESGKSVVYLDVLGSVFNQASNFGAVRITSDTPSLNIVSVTSTPGFGGTLSQTIPAVLSSDLIPAGSSRSILYIREGDGFRSNLILASNADVFTAVDAALVSPAGETLATKSYSIPPNGMTQISRVVRDMGVSGAVTGARLVLSSSTPGAAFTGLASVIDETTNDPTAVEAR